MDPITLIVTAIVSGASAALNETAGDAVRDAYKELKGLVARKLAGRRAGQTTLEEVDRDPETWEKPLESQLRATSAGDDEAIVRAAQALMTQLDPAGSQRGKYTVTITGGRNIVVGDHAHVTMNLRDD